MAPKAKPRSAVANVRVKKVATSWWAGVYVLARHDQEQDYEVKNVYWRLARSEHEAMIGLEDLNEKEPIQLPMTKAQADERAKKKNHNERRFFDVRLRMMYRCGSIEIPMKPKSVWRTSTPFPANWSPSRPLEFLVN